MNRHCMNQLEAAEWLKTWLETQDAACQFFFQEYIPIGNKKINAGKKARNKCEVTLGFRSTFITGEE